MRIFILSLFILLLLGSCGPEYSLETFSDKREYRSALLRAHRKALKDNTVLASFTGGNITRSDMVRYGEKMYGLESVVGSINRIDCLLSSVRKQRMLIREIVEKRIFLSEAKLRRFAERADIRSMLQHIDHKALIPIHYRQVISKQLTVREPAAYVQHLLLRFPRSIPDPDSTVLPPWAVSVRNQTEKVRGKALSGTSFDTLVTRYSKDYTKAENGHLGWIVASSMGERYWKAIAGLPVGAVSKPIVMENGVYLARVLKRKVLTGANYRKLLHSRFAFRLKEQLQKIGKRRFVEGLYRAPGVRVREDLLTGGKPGAIVASIDGWKLALSEYENKFKAFSKGYKIGTFSAKKRLIWRKRFLREYILTPRLIIRDSLKRGLDKTDAYTKAQGKTKAIRERVLYIEMKDHLFRTGLGTVSEARIKRIYDKYKKTRYYSLRAITKQQAEKQPEDMVIRKDGRIFVKVIRPFESVKGKATSNIVRDLRYAWVDTFIRKKLKEMGFAFSPLDKFSAVFYTGKR